MTDRRAVADWVDRYERAWRTPGTDALDELFTAAATYSPSPWSDPVEGLDAIRRFGDAGRTGPDEGFRMQSDVVAIDGNVAVVRVGVDYDEGNRWRDLWVLTLDDTGRCDRQGAGYVTILIGANDACTSSESTMTSVGDFEARFAAGMATLDPDNRRVKVFVPTIPDIYRLWEIGKNSSSARTAWSSFGICPSMLDNPTSTHPDDEARRQRVRQRVIDFNASLVAVCAVYDNCDDDGGAVFAYPFQLSQMSGWDYFHPNEAGQAVLADVTFAAGFEWAAATEGGGKGGGKK